MGADAQRALDRLFADCAADPGCREAFPDLPETALGRGGAARAGQPRHVVAPGAGHGVIAHGCADDVIAEFIEAGSHEDLDVHCLERIRRPPFMLSAAGTDP